MSVIIIAEKPTEVIDRARPLSERRSSVIRESLRHAARPWWDCLRYCPV